MPSDPARPARRLAPLVDRVTLTLDGEPIDAERGEPLAAALIAAGKMTIARSPKFHRPRGPACMRGACDGCLARVDDTPNVMTCLTPAEKGMVVVSQNRLGPRDADLLRMTDWFFPDGMNHHELFAGIPGIQSIMQGFARRVAGLGKLPSEPEAAKKARRRRVDVVVVGAGPAGMAVAGRLAERTARRGSNQRPSIEVLDDRLVPGGSVTALDPQARHSFEPILSAFEAARASGVVRLRLRTTAGAVYGHDAGRDLLVVGEGGAEVLETKALVLACGAHDGALAFEGNDVPGVMSARAAGWLLEWGVLVGQEVLIVVPEGGGPFGEAYARRAPPNLTKTQLVRGDPIAVRGTSRVKGLRVQTSSGERSFDADAVLLDAPRSPAYELCEQAGARLVHESRGFVVHTDPRGRIEKGCWATGESTGVAFDAAAIAEHASRVATDIEL